MNLGRTSPMSACCSSYIKSQYLVTYNADNIHYVLRDNRLFWALRATADFKNGHAG